MFDREDAPLSPADANDPEPATIGMPTLPPTAPGELLIGDSPETMTHLPVPNPECDPIPVSVAVPGYEVECVVGRGGMGVVYKARHLKLKRTVALKMILTGSHAGARERSRFRIEAEAVARLQHPNIVQIHEVGEADGHPYCALEFVEGGTLARKLRFDPLSAHDSAALVETLAQAMQLAHSRNVVHRDLKPANILLTDDGAPKITDFGLARRTDGTGGDTVAGAVLGTPSYMAPEQAFGRTNEAGPLADIYSLGAILYDCLAGQPPFKADSNLATIDLVRTQEPVSPSRLRPGTPRDLEVICLKCLRKEPDKRYASAAELAEELGRFRRGEPILARPVGRIERTWRWCRRNPALAAACALAVLALVTASAVSAALAIRERSHTRDLAKALADSETLRSQADALLAESYLERGIAMCERGEHARGLLWMARGLETAPDDARDIQHALRANLADWSRRGATVRGICRHPGAVSLLSPDGRTLLVVDGAGRAELRNGPADARIADLGTVSPHPLAAFSADGRAVAIAGRSGGECRVWDAANGKPLVGKWPVSAGTPRAISLGAGGRRVLLLGPADRLRIWDRTTDRTIEIRGQFSSASLSPTGECILAVGLNEARLYSAESGVPIGEPFIHEQPITSTAFSRDGRFAATGGRDRTAQVWSAASGSAVGPRARLRKAVETLALSPDGSLAFYGGSNSGVVGDVAAGAARGAPLTHGNDLVVAAFSPDGRNLLTGGMDGIARLWDVATTQPRGAIIQCSSTVSAIAFGPGPGEFATEVQLHGEYRFWEMREEPPAIVNLPVGDRIHAIRLHRDGSLAATGTGGEKAGEARVWDARTGLPRTPPLAHPAVVRAVAFSSDGRKLLTGCDDGLARVWNLFDGRMLGAPVSHGGSIRGVSFAAGGSVLVTGGTDERVRRWAAASRTELGEAWKQDGQVLALEAADDGDAILTGGTDSLGRILATGRLERRLRHQDWIIAVAISPDGSLALTGSDDTDARLWDANSGRALRPPLAHRDAVSGVAFDGTGRFAATGCEDRTARRWDVATGRAIGPALPHAEHVVSLAFRTDASVLVAAGADASLRHWNLTVPMLGSPRRVTRRIQLLTGQELDDTGAPRLLDAAEWRDRVATER